MKTLLRKITFKDIIVALPLIIICTLSFSSTIKVKLLNTYITNNMSYYPYDDKYISGETVINALYQFNDLTILVDNGQTESTYTSANREANIKSVRNKTDLEHYVHPASVYHSELIKDKDIVAGIKFIRRPINETN